LLVAEDERLVAEGLRAQLEDLGYEVVAVAGDGRQAIELADRHHPDLVLMDIQMPEMDGLSAARVIFETLGIPVVILSAFGQDSFVNQAMQTGVFSYILKPTTSQGLNAAIQVALQRYVEQCQLQSKVDQLEQTLRDRKMIERAKGILMTKRQMSEPEAFRFLQKQSQDRRVPMARLAETLVEAEELLGTKGPIFPPTGSPSSRPGMGDM